MPGPAEHRPRADAGAQTAADALSTWRLAFETGLFAGPDLHSAVLTRLPAGMAVTLIEERGGFCRVRTPDGQVGFVGRLALVWDRSRGPRGARAGAAPPAEPPPLPWEVERADAAGSEATTSEAKVAQPSSAAPPAAAADEPALLPAAEAPALAAAAPVPDATAEPTAHHEEESPAAEEQPGRARQWMPALTWPWKRAKRLRHRARAALALDDAPALPERPHRTRRRLLALLLALLVLIGLFEVLAWGLGLLAPQRTTAGEPQSSPVVVAVRTPEGTVELSVDTRALAGTATLGVVWIVLVVAVVGGSAAVPYAVLLVPALALATALNAATGLTPVENVLLVDLTEAESTPAGGPPVALRRVTRERITFTVSDEVAGRLPGQPPAPRPRVASIPPPAATGRPPAPSGGAPAAPRPPDALDIGLILDASGSMLERAGDRPKIEIAKEVLNDLAGRIQPGVHVGLWVYGHRQGDRTFQCQQIELLSPMGPVEPPAFRERIGKIVPFGWTPIAKSIELAAKEFRHAPGITEVMVLVSDGEETCGGDPVKTAEEVKRASPRLTIHTVGLAVTPETRQQLERTAVAGGGTYYDARDARSLAEALAQITRAAPAAPTR